MNNKWVIFDEATLKITAQKNGDTILFDTRSKAKDFASKFLQRTYQILKVKK